MPGVPMVMLRLKTTPASNWLPDPESGYVPSPLILTAIWVGAQLPESRYVTENTKLVDVVPVPGLTPPLDSDSV